jgi:Plasma-membrane choline transporter
LNRCVPTAPIDLAYNNKTANGTTADESFASKKMDDSSTVMNIIMADMIRAWPYILGFSFAALVVGFVWLLMMKLFAGVMVWFTIFAAYAIVLGITFFCFYKTDQLKTEYNDTPEAERTSNMERNITVAEVFSYIFAVISAILIILLIWMRRRIQLAIGIMKEATVAIARMPTIIFWPIPIFFLQACWSVWYIVTSSFLATGAEPLFNGENGTFSGYADESDGVKALHFYNLFGFLWVEQFLVALGQMTMAGAIAIWYWQREDENGHRELPLSPVLKSFWITIRYHLGSLAFGSFILAVVKFIRAMIKWVQQRLNGASGSFAKRILSACDCLFACFERFIKFLNKNAYIMVAIKGENFCTSAQRAFTLLLSNILRVGAVNAISDFLMFLGKLFITMSVTLAAAWALSSDPEITFWAIPVLVICLISFFVAQAFMTVYDMAIDTILLSFCEDVEVNDGSKERPYFMPDSLLEFVDSGHLSKLCGCC